METAVFLIVALVSFYALKSFLVRDLSIENARELIRKGAALIDVRSEEECSTSHIESVTNIPLNELHEKIHTEVPDKDRTILLHCRTGSRSMIGKRTLKQMGYSNVYNLGPFKRAKKIIKDN